MAEPRYCVELFYIRDGTEIRLDIDVAAGSTVEDVLEGSGLLQRCPEIDLKVFGVGIFGRVVSPNATVADGDRVEVYRPLKVDPRTARRERARIARTKPPAPDKKP